MTTETDFPTPRVDVLNAPYWDALRQGFLAYQNCSECDHAWLPARSECPNCLSPDHQWQRASGRARLISWIVYHRPFNSAFNDRIPYNVAVVELEEGVTVP